MIYPRNAKVKVDTLQSSAGLVSEHKMFNMFRPLKPGHVYSTMGPDFIRSLCNPHISKYKGTKASKYFENTQSAN